MTRSNAIHPTIHIALISEHASPLATLGGVDCGGQNVYVASLAQALARLGYQVDVITRHEDPALPQIVKFAPNVRVIHIQAGPVQVIPKEQILPYMDQFRQGFEAFIKRTRVQYALVHSHFFMSALVGMQLQQRLGLPHIVTFHALGLVRQLHQGASDSFPPERIAIEQAVVQTADRIMAECPQDRADLIELYHADPTRLVTIPCGFDPAELHPMPKAAARLRVGLDPRRPTILHLGRIVPRKGADNIIEALALLRDHYGLAPQLVIVGGDSDQPDPRATPELGRLASLATSLGLDQQVVFTGRRGRDQLRYYYAAADIFVTTPWYEPFGMTVIEAMACGTPVIGADVGGIKYSIVDGRTGLLVPPRNPAALAAALARTLQDPVLLRGLARRSLQRARQHFTWDAIATQTAALYRELAAAPAAPTLAPSATTPGPTPRASATASPAPKPPTLAAEPDATAPILSAPAPATRHPRVSRAGAPSRSLPEGH